MNEYVKKAAETELFNIFLCSSCHVTLAKTFQHHLQYTKTWLQKCDA